MRRTWVGLPALALAVGCAGRPRPVHEAPAPPPAPPARPCPSIDTARANAAFERARPFLERFGHEEHLPADVVEKGLADLEEAAENGHLEAEYRVGNARLGLAFSDHAPEPKDHAAYVRSIAWLRVAALRGHRAALETYAGLERPKLDASVRFSLPLDAIPRPWIAEGFRRADRWFACAPPEAKTHYEPPAPTRPATVLDKSESGWTRVDDPEGPLLRVSFAEDSGQKLEPPLRARLLAALPALHDCYAALLVREPESGGELSVALAASGDVGVTGAGDEALRLCAKRAVEALGLAERAREGRAARLDVELFAHALSAPELPEAKDAARVERWEADGSCWGFPPIPPCPPHKICEAASRERVRCPRAGE